jgi:flavin reductase (DIM6/NTAB) family NADH-FMN oxidoreductase RutF
MVFFICPRPVVLVSVAHGEKGNIFPMNLMGPLGNGYFAFALNSARQAAPLVERAGKLALSSLPIDQFAVARQLGKNHRREFVDWNQLSFETKKSTALALPVPRFALRIREMEVEAVRRLGSHTLFVARILGEEHWAEGAQCFMIHGIYKAWRQKSAHT